MKLFYRPKGVQGDSQQAYRQLTWRRQGKTVTVQNPTPFYVTLLNYAGQRPEYRRGRDGRAAFPAARWRGVRRRAAARCSGRPLTTMVGPCRRCVFRPMRRPGRGNKMHAELRGAPETAASRWLLMMLALILLGVMHIVLPRHRRQRRRFTGTAAGLVRAAGRYGRLRLVFYGIRGCAAARSCAAWRWRRYC
ncbi:fimbrial chaperone BcfG [Klebsiella michiganensis]|uniref:Fimbrial chaperone BcfG n=1 Tax=Klebsiella michiganensis TaxID=1134687 RepID=A0A7H4PEF4_9ENTR|nr:fimbrial chaperone BcfG [Klebsiella michiganensis]